MVSYFASCRIPSRLGPGKQICPKDPRPHIASETGVRSEGSGTYAPWDISDAEADAVRDTPAW